MKSSDFNVVVTTNGAGDVVGVDLINNNEPEDPALKPTFNVVEEKHTFTFGRLRFVEYPRATRMWFDVYLTASEADMFINGDNPVGTIYKDVEGKIEFSPSDNSPIDYGRSTLGDITNAIDYIVGLDSKKGPSS